LKKPKTTPECEQLTNLVIEGLEASHNLFGSQKCEAALVALKKLHKKRCAKSIEYIIQVSCGMNGLFDEFAQRICKEATKYLDELSQ
jgi:hypothetical protein